MDGQVKRKPIGVILQEKGLINETHIKFALQEQKISNEKLGDILERLGFITQFDIASTLSEQENMPYMDIDRVVPQERVLKLFNKTLCLKNLFLPIEIKDKNLVIAVADIDYQNLAQLVTRQTGLQPHFFLAERRKIINAINSYYYFLDNPVETLLQKEVNILAQDRDLARGFDSFIQLLLQYAIKMRTTDIHIRPMEKSVNIAFRIDGVMMSVLSLPVSLYRLISALKMKSEIDIAEQRLPQDGRFSETVLNNDYDFRVSTIICPFGENLVMRVLPKQSSVMGMRQLGFFDNDVKRVETMFNDPFGIILLTGPTGSGKSTTLYAGIRSLDLLQKNVLTVENPIEYNVPLLRQTQVNEKAGYTFSSAMRYFLRHDPDVILVGEIRDKETAATAISASTTGHLVLSTLHTNSALGAIPRLKDLGIHSFLIADSLLGVVSQRLIRKICPACKEEYSPGEEEILYLGDKNIHTLYRGKGCELCNGYGYFGRTLIYEILSINAEIKRLIDKEADQEQIMKHAVATGFTDIFQTCVRKVKDGTTTIDEARRILGSTGKQFF